MFQDGASGIRPKAPEDERKKAPNTYLIKPLGNNATRNDSKRTQHSSQDDPKLSMPTPGTPLGLPKIASRKLQTHFWVPIKTRCLGTIPRDPQGTQDNPKETQRLQRGPKNLDKTTKGPLNKPKCHQKPCLTRQLTPQELQSRKVSKTGIKLLPMFFAHVC